MGRLDKYLGVVSVPAGGGVRANAADGVSVLLATLARYDAQEARDAAMRDGRDYQREHAELVAAGKRLMKITGEVDGSVRPRGLTKAGLAVFDAAVRWGSLNRIAASGSDTSLLRELGWAEADLREAISAAGLRYPKGVAANHAKAIAPAAH